MPRVATMKPPPLFSVAAPYAKARTGARTRSPLNMRSLVKRMDCHTTSSSGDHANARLVANGAGIDQWNIARLIADQKSSSIPLIRWFRRRTSICQCE